MSASVTLRSAVAGDAAATRALTRDAYAKWVLLIGREPLPMTADYVEALKKHRIDLLYLDGIRAALIEMVPGSDYLLIENVAVSPVYEAGVWADI